jgi:glutamate racemase
LDAIGVFDSGVGGLTVAAAIRRRLPRESILYLGDTARLPYGSKSPETVTRYTRRNIEFLAERGVKAVVVACNTASALALPNLDPDHHLTMPTWGVIEPGARKAAALSRGRVGVIATDATVLSDAYPRALRALRPDLVILSQPCPLFVPLVEEGWHDDPITEQVVERYLRPLLNAGVDTLVLGCTHYPLLVPVLRRVAGPDVTLVDSAEAVAEVVAAGLAAGGLEAASSSTAAPEHHVCVTDAGEKFHQLAGRILGEDVTLEWVEVT